MTADEVRVGARFAPEQTGDTFAFSYRGTEYALAVQERSSRRNCRASG